MTQSHLTVFDHHSAAWAQAFQALVQTMPPEERNELWALLHLRRGKREPEERTWAKLLDAAPFLTDPSKNQEILALLSLISPESKWWMVGK